MNYFINDIVPFIGTTGAVITILAVLNSIIVEVLKKFFPKYTHQLVAIISAIILTLLFFISTGDYTSAIEIAKTIIRGILSGFIVALVSTEGYDSIDKLVIRVIKKS